MIHRQCFLRSENATTPATLDAYGMSGLFSKLVKSLAKPFTKVFKPHTLLGKIADPLGLMSRNIKWTGKIADVVGTAATLAVGAYAVGAAAAGTGGGFWATAGTGAKLAAAKLGSGLAAAGKGAAALAAGAAKAMGPTAAAMMVGGSGAQTVESGGTPPVFTETNAFMGSETLSPIGSTGPMDFPSPMMPDGSGDMPGAVVPVEDVAPADGPNWLLIGGITLAAALILMQKKGR